MITVAYNDINKSVNFFLDKAGIKLLISKLNELKEDYQHVHIYATGDDRGLSLKAMHDGQRVYGEVILERCTPDDWVDPE